MKLSIEAVIIIVSSFFSLSFSSAHDSVEIFPGYSNLTDLTISTGENVTVTNRPYFNILGDVWNSGTFSVRNENEPMKLRMSGAEFRNTGKVDFTSFSQFGESSYVIFARKGFWNEGEIAFGICTNQTQSIPFVVASFGLWINRGKMIFQKGIGSMTELYIVGKSAGNDSLAITNNGSICLYNTHWNTNMDIKGHGCVAVGSDSRLEISFARGENAVQNTQTIYLESPASVLAISGLTSLLTPPFINIAGFGQHNWIDLDIEFNNLTTEYDYFGHSGLLVIKLSKRQVVQIQIGESYDLRYLKLTSGPAGSRLVYEPPSPNTPPNACSCKPIC